MKRWIGALALTVVPLATYAASLNDARQQMTPLFSDLGQQNRYWFASTGILQVGQTQHTLNDYVSVQYGTTLVGGQPATTVELDARTYLDGALTRRVVGDGSGFMWDYDATSNSYRVARFGNSLAPGAQGTTYVAALGNFLRSRALGPSSMLAHTVALALQAKESGGSVASVWEPFFASSDPVVDLDAKTITAVKGQQNPMTMTYKWQSVNGIDKLDSIGFQQSKTVNNVAIEWSWNAVYHPNEAMPNQDFTFNPGSARQVVVQQRLG